jgi:translocation and assembly module TamA
VGPLEDGTPTGGRSQFLISQELRWRWTESFGLVGFVDGGVVTEEAFYDPTVDDLRWGTGLGTRYFTPVGPLRLDMAVPIDRRSGIDAPWQFYISLGQAF